MIKCILVILNCLVFSSTIYLGSITNNSHLPDSFKARFYVFIMEHTLVFLLILYAKLYNIPDRTYFTLFLTFGCFLQFGAAELYLAAQPTAQINLHDEAFLGKNSSWTTGVFIYIYAYYFYNFICGIVGLVEILANIWLNFFVD